MLKQTKNNELECHAFKAQCSMSYFVIELDDEALCLLCYDILAVLKECNKLRKTMVRRFRKCKAEYLITAEFLHKNKRMKIRLQLKFLSGSFVG